MAQSSVMRGEFSAIIDRTLGPREQNRHMFVSTIRRLSSRMPLDNIRLPLACTHCKSWHDLRHRDVDIAPDCFGKSLASAVVLVFNF